MITKESIPPIFSKDNLKIRLHVDSVHTHYGMPYATEAAIDTISQLNSAEYREEIYFVNNTYQNVSVMGRNGLAISVPYVSSCTNNDFIIRKIFKLKGFSLNTAIASIQSLTHVDGAELQEIKKCLTSIAKSNYTAASVMIDYIVTVEDFKNKGNTLYHYQTDLVLSFNNAIEMDAHPYSARFLNIGTFGITNNYVNQQELSLKIRYVNHSLNAAPAYLNIAGKVFTVFPQKDAPSRKITCKGSNGKLVEKVYDDYLQFFYSSHCDPEVNDSSGVTAIRMTLEEARIKLGLYDNYNDAFNSGNTELNRKEEVLRIQHQLELLKQSTAVERARYEREDISRREALLIKEHDLELIKKDTLSLKQDLELATARLNIDILEQKKSQAIIDIRMQELTNEKNVLDMSRKEQDEKLSREKKEFDERLKDLREEHEHRLKQESLYWRDFYENRSMQRKDSSEFVKYIPGLLIGIGGIAAAWLKFSGSKDK